MGEYISNRIRCKNCEHYSPLDKLCGICLAQSYGNIKIFVRRNQQIPFCFEEKGKRKNEKDTDII